MAPTAHYAAHLRQHPLLRGAASMPSCAAAARDDSGGGSSGGSGGADAGLGAPLRRHGSCVLSGGTPSLPQRAVVPVVLFPPPSSSATSSSTSSATSGSVAMVGSGGSFRGGLPRSQSRAQPPPAVVTVAVAATATAAAATAAAATPMPHGSRPACFICFEALADAVFMECGHAGVCAPCARTITHGYVDAASGALTRGSGTCPVCRNPVTQVLRIGPDVLACSGAVVAQVLPAFLWAAAPGPAAGGEPALPTGWQ